MTCFLKIENNAVSSIAEKFDRTEVSLNEDVVALKKWMKSQLHLPEILSDKYIQNFLILNKCSIERTKKSIDMYYTLRSKIPEIFEDMNPKLSHMQRQLEIGCTLPVPKMTKDMYRVLVFKMFDKNLIEEMQPPNVMRQLGNIQELRLMEDVMFGDIFIFDFEGITFGYMVKLTPPFVAKVLAIYEKIYSIPLKAIYFVNSPPFMNTLLSILKNVLKPKIFSRVFAAADTSILAEVVPKECLPKDYGGEAPSMEELRELLKIKLNEKQNRFDELDKLRVNEDLRPEPLENDEILGFHGNFKKLNVD